MEATVHEGYSKVGNTGSNQITTQTLTNWGKCPESSDYGSRQTKKRHLDGGRRGFDGGLRAKGLPRHRWQGQMNIPGGAKALW